jgi:hypothetical protein
MTIKELVDYVELVTDGDPRRMSSILWIQVPTGTVGGTPGVHVKTCGFGLDGDSGKLILYPEVALRLNPKKERKSSVK